MRYYLDTNILAFLITEQQDEISEEVKRKIADYENLFMTSSVCVHELIHLYQIGKLPFRKGMKAPLPSDVLGWLEEMGIRIVAVGKVHLQQLSELPMQPDHRDPNDRLVIAQAIADRIPLVSSDRKFDWYRRHGLEFIFNER
ncbi:MAG TPA: type II toxin-antitoxin system VapC family toxin [Candidatus Bacteroides pullicola]|uniref:Type II toxin-antitoxin system VapC family toxin n=1 Tax=Candidatus Bacteroides pullicola TaxID=2838475 RepID=A0A9D1ZHA2_9BACE|nr:type II toxin-antitoxin system VapC family toxin [Candidatus Bacteroides pullicola]